MNATDLTQLNGQSILVKSTQDRRDPPIAVRGTLEVCPGLPGEPVVRIVLQFPDMCNRAAHQTIIPLDGAGVDRLLAAERVGVYEYTVDGPLDPEVGEAEGGPH